MPDQDEPDAHLLELMAQKHRVVENIADVITTFEAEEREPDDWEGDGLAYALP